MMLEHWIRSNYDDVDDVKYGTGSSKDNNWVS